MEKQCIKLEIKKNKLINKVHHHHHHISVMELGHLLTHTKCMKKIISAEYHQQYFKSHTVSAHWTV